jgi:hypothetical protein
MSNGSALLVVRVSDYSRNTSAYASTNADVREGFRRTLISSHHRGPPGCASVAAVNEIMSQLLSTVEGRATRHAGHSGFIHAIFGLRNGTAEGPTLKMAVIPK